MKNYVNAQDWTKNEGVHLSMLLVRMVNPYIHVQYITFVLSDDLLAMPATKAEWRTPNEPDFPNSHSVRP